MKLAMTIAETYWMRADRRDPVTSVQMDTVPTVDTDPIALVCVEVDVLAGPGSVVIAVCIRGATIMMDVVKPMDSGAGHA